MIYFKKENDKYICKNSNLKTDVIKSENLIKKYGENSLQNEFNLPVLSLQNDKRYDINVVENISIKELIYKRKFDLLDNDNLILSISSSGAIYSEDMLKSDFLQNFIQKNLIVENAELITLINAFSNFLNIFLRNDDLISDPNHYWIEPNDGLQRSFKYLVI